MDLDARVERARRAYADRHPHSRQWHERARSVLPGGNTRSVLAFEPFPFRVDRAEGRELIDVDGHRYIDLLGNYTAGLLGHSPEAVRHAARTALDTGWSYGSVHPDEVRLAERLVDRFASIERIRFTNSGTEANLMALAVATHHTGRTKVVVFAHGYHGGVLTFTSQPSPVNVPHDWIVLPYNDLDAVTQAFDEHGEDIGAVLVEPMQGSAGCIPGDHGFLVGLRALTRDHGTVLIFDEVMTSRFSVGGAQQLLDLRPDLTTLGKYLGGGLSFGAFGGAVEIMSHFDPTAGGTLGHAGTFNNNVASMAAGVAAIDDVLTAGVLARTHERGERLRTGLNDAFAETGVQLRATGVGSLMNLHGTRRVVRSAADLADADQRIRELFFFEALAAGFFLAPRGFIALSVEITDDDIDAFLDVARDFDPVGA